MAITAAQVKRLRELTGAGMMECKKALEVTSGDIDAAIDEMRKSGSLKAAKKSDRVTAEGYIAIESSADNKIAVMVYIACETDFVSRDNSFVEFAQNVAKVALNEGISDVESLANAAFDGKTVEEARQELVAKIGENVQILKVRLVSSETWVSNYRHGSRIGVLVDLTKNDDNLGRDIAMHIAASRPTAVSPKDIPVELVNKEREIFTAQAAESGKPPEIVEKMVEGRVKKFLNEASLVGQPFVKNPDQTVGDLLSQANAKVNDFVRFEVGEGIERKVDDFAAEVAAQVRGNE